jgi:hypothetical protein
MIQQVQVASALSQTRTYRKGSEAQKNHVDRP